ncbi:MAG: porin [Zoogloeaceae bacterium]|nr:porin [Zoogloeaceae bacterium]
MMKRYESNRLNFIREHPMRQKRFSRFLVAILTALVAPGAAWAQTNVEIYGSIDIGFSRRGDNTERGVGTKYSIDSGTISGNRLGFRGTEELGNGVKALFTLESGFKADDGSLIDENILFYRQAFIGLTGGFGTLSVGRLYAPRDDLVSSIDPFEGSSVGQAANVFDDVSFYGDSNRAFAYITRVDNAVSYVSPAWNGLNVTFLYATNVDAPEQIGNKGDAKTLAFLPRYQKDALDVGLSYQGIRMDEVVSGGASGKTDQWTFGGSYNFGVVKLAAYYDQYKARRSDYENSEKLKTWLVGATVPIGKHSVLTSCTQSRFDDHTHDRPGTARQCALGYLYFLSARTSFFAVYSDIHNDDAKGEDGGNDGNRRVHRHANAADTYNDWESGYQNGFQFGMKHTF